MRIGELAKKSGCHLETIRYYERIGLMPSPPRSLSGYRQYTVTDVERLNFTVGSRALGFHLDEVRSLRRLASESALSCAEVDAMAREHLAQVKDKQRELASLASELQAMIGACGQGSRAQCTILRSLSHRPSFGKRRLRESLPTGHLGSNYRGLDWLLSPQSPSHDVIGMAKFSKRPIGQMHGSPGKFPPLKPGSGVANASADGSRPASGSGRRLGRISPDACLR